VLNCKPGLRRSFKIWSEGRVPNVVFEVTSRKTKRQDQLVKPEVYARIGVRELFLYDPTIDYLTPALQGYRLDGGQYLPIEPTASGSLVSSELQLRLRLDRERLVMEDAVTGLRLLTAAEAEQERAEAERERAEAERERAEAERERAETENKRAEAEKQRADAAERRLKEMESELNRLREQLEQRGG
jgi:hypothetical protein